MRLTRAPRPALRPFVRSLWAIDLAGEPALGPARERVLPAGSMHLAIRLSDDPLRVFDGVDDATGRAMGLAVVGGARAGFYVRDVSRPARSVGAELEPGASALLFGAPADALAERHTPLDELWGRAAAEARERLDAARGLDERLDLLEALLAARLPRVRAVHPAVAHALGRLHEGAEVGAVIDETGYSHRRFLDLFRSAVGLGPKVYCRVRRFHAAIERLAASPGAACADVAAAVGYSDQAHMTREFREFAGVSPKAYRALAPNSARHVPVRGG
jgi:AraC-like DNA-binding protein